MRVDTLLLKVGLTVGEPAQEPAAPRKSQSLDLASGLPASVLSEIARGLSGGTSLPPDVLAWARASYGVDLSNVQVIADDRSRSLNAAAGTHGLAVGDHSILLADPHDQETIYHEAAHMAQEAAGHTGSRSQREAEASRAELVFARRQTATPTAYPAGIDLRQLADHVYRLLLDQLQAEQQRRF